MFIYFLQCSGKNWYLFSLFQYSKPSWHLLNQSQQWKHQNNVLNLLTLNKKRPAGNEHCNLFELAVLKSNFQEIYL